MCAQIFVVSLGSIVSANALNMHIVPLSLNNINVPCGLRNLYSSRYIFHDSVQAGSYFYLQYLKYIWVACLVLSVLLVPMSLNPHRFYLLYVSI